MICLDLGSEFIRACLCDGKMQDSQLCELSRLPALEQPNLLLMQRDGTLSVAPEMLYDSDEILALVHSFNLHLGHRAPVALCGDMSGLQSYTARDIASELLEELRDVFAPRAANLRDVSELLVALPNHYSQSLYNDLREAATENGFSPRFLSVYEAIACAFQAQQGAPQSPERQLLVGDWGANGLRLASLRSDGNRKYKLTEHSACIHSAGASRMIDALCHCAMAQLGIGEDALCNEPMLCLVLREQVSKQIRKVSRLEPVKIQLVYADTTRGAIIIPREYRVALEAIAQECVQYINDFIRTLPDEQIPHTAFLCGGGLRIPWLMDIIALGLPTNIRCHFAQYPDKTILYGLAYHAMS